MKTRFLAAVLALGLAGSGSGCAGRQSHHSPVLSLMLLGGVVVGGALVYMAADGEECTDPAGRCGEEDDMFPEPPGRPGDL
jgi:hypothetical protein